MDEKKLPEGMRRQYLQPIWNTKRVYDETGVVVGEEGEICFLRRASGDVVVRDIRLKKTYREGVDYVLTERGLRRLRGGELLFWNTDEYFAKEKPNVVLEVEPNNVEFSFDEPRYIRFSEGADGVRNYLSICYSAAEKWLGFIPQADEHTRAFAEALKRKKKAKITFYGDSITVGCNASGTEYGGMLAPYLPPWYRLVTDYLSEKYEAKIEVVNEAVGGWTTKNGQDAFDEKVLPHCASTDLFVLAFGMNDPYTETTAYAASLREMLEKYFAKNANGYALLVAPMLPNSQCKAWRRNQEIFEATLLEIRENYPRVGVARITSFIFDMERTGKRIRDWLANSVNHPTDFCVRIYAQVILKTLLGAEFEEEYNERNQRIY